MQKSRLKVMGAAAAVAVVAGGGIGAWWITNDSSNGTVVSAEAGAEARAQQALHLPGNGGAMMAAENMSSSKMAADSLPVDCGIGAEPYVPSEEELASANADTDALVAVLERYGVTHTVITDDSGFRYVETDYADMVASSVVSSYWESRYPPELPSQADLDSVKQQNDVIAKYLDDAGVSYTRTTDDSGWESLDWDYENPVAEEAVNAAYAELFPPQPPTAEQLAAITADNDELAAAFDAAGIAYTRMSDEFGWEWIEWDYEDEALAEKVNAVFEQLYPIEPGNCPTLMVDDAPMAESDVAAESSVAVESDVAVEEPVPADGGFTPEMIAQRDAEAAALQSGFEAAGVTVRTEGESPWQIVIFDVSNDAGIDVVKAVLATRV